MKKYKLKFLAMAMAFTIMLVYSSPMASWAVAEENISDMPELTTTYEQMQEDEAIPEEVGTTYDPIKDGDKPQPAELKQYESQATENKIFDVSHADKVEITEELPKGLEINIVEVSESGVPNINGVTIPEYICEEKQKSIVKKAIEKVKKIVEEKIQKKVETPLENDIDAKKENNQISVEGGFDAKFFLRNDNKIIKEPHDYPASQYTPNNAEKKWLEGKIFENEEVSNDNGKVRENIKKEPSAEQIKNAGIEFNPKKQEVLWYVIKKVKNETPSYHVNGIIVDKKRVEVKYYKNYDKEDEEEIGSCYFTEDEEIKVSGEMNNKVNVRKDYTLLGWSTERNASDKIYKAGEELNIKNSDTIKLYAQWKQNKNKYSVVHLVENKNGKYVQEPNVKASLQELDGKIGGKTKAEARTGIVNGLDYDYYTPQEITQKTISEKGDTVVEVKYKRNKVAFSAGEISYVYNGMMQSNYMKYYIHSAENENFKNVRVTTKEHKDCGTYVISFVDKSEKVTSDKGKKYFATYKDGTMQITPKKVLVKLMNLTKQKGENDPDFMATVEGIADGDKINFKIDREKGENVGTYEIKATGDKKQGNYEVSYKNAKLTITEKVVAGGNGSTGDKEKPAGGVVASKDKDNKDNKDKDNSEDKTSGKDKDKSNDSDKPSRKRSRSSRDKDEPTPKKAGVTIEDEKTPLGNVVSSSPKNDDNKGIDSQNQQTTSIEESDVPLAKLPKTGGTAPLQIFVVGLLISALGILVKKNYN